MNTTNRYAVWDLPVRLFHVALITLILLQWGTGEWHWLDMQWHAWLGYATLALVLWRLSWGLVGSESARFSDFVRGPRAVLAYARTVFTPGKRVYAGHNPMGGWSVIAILLCLLVQGVTGLFASEDDVIAEGALARMVSHDTAHLLTEIHEANKTVLLVLIGLHLAAVLFYELVKRERIVLPMVHGHKRMAADPGVRLRSGWLALALLLLCAGAVGALVAWGEGRLPF